MPYWMIKRKPILQVNVWDKPLSAEEIQSLAECRSNLQGNYVAWEEGWILHNVTSYEVPLAHLCDRDLGPTYFWFPAGQYPLVQYLCPALGSRLPRTFGEAFAMLEVGERKFKESDNCYTDYWLEVNDIEEEGVWKAGDDPVDMSTIGWSRQEPNGLQYENCAAVTKGGVSDIDCSTNTKCIACFFEEQQRFSLQGTCETELRNFYLTAFQYTTGEIDFVGYGAYYIKKVEGVWTWTNAVTNQTIARMEETIPNFPMGRRWWRLNQLVCGQKPGGRRRLLLSPCLPDQFTCDDATCIPLLNRCDLKYDCRDNSDEVECELVAFPQDYQNHLPPRAGGRGEKSLAIVLTINVEFLSVKTMGMTMEISHEFGLSWIDNRLLYQNLKEDNTMNSLPAATMMKLWTPQVSFVNTKNNERTLIDAETTMVVHRRADAIGRDKTAPAEGKPSLFTQQQMDIFSGDKNALSTRRKYGTVFMCDLDLALYPFDAQECYMRLRISSASKSFLEFDTIESSVNSTANKLLLEYEVGELFLQHGEAGMFSEVMVRIPLTRRYGYAILNIYIPTLVLLVVSYVTLFFRPAIFDTRMMSALTVQLVIATLFSQVSASLPKTSYFKMVDVWLIFCIGLTFLTIIFHVLVDYMVNQTKVADKEQPGKAFVNTITVSPVGSGGGFVSSNRNGQRMLRVNTFEGFFTNSRNEVLSCDDNPRQL
ncbi:uncharacterized protein LOC121869925 [Homarus americanus]|uniref:uncharacterized protein LOC121869925 n=1 Tax=Homarus americanus TaxID=6706 RepID=UPI001C44A2F0|nr:uncharacterized protein LOC121869925 [Homarus americanus]